MERILVRNIVFEGHLRKTSQNLFTTEFYAINFGALVFPKKNYETQIKFSTKNILVFAMHFKSEMM